MISEKLNLPWELVANKIKEYKSYDIDSELYWYFNSYNIDIFINPTGWFKRGFKQADATIEETDNNVLLIECRNEEILPEIRVLGQMIHDRLKLDVKIVKYFDVKDNITGEVYLC